MCETVETVGSTCKAVTYNFKIGYLYKISKKTKKNLCAKSFAASENSSMV